MPQDLLQRLQVGPTAGATVASVAGPPKGGFNTRPGAGVPRVGRGQAKPRVDRRRERRQARELEEAAGSGSGESEGGEAAAATASAPTEEWQRLVLKEDEAEDARLLAVAAADSGSGEQEDDVFFYDGDAASPGRGGSAGGVGRHTQEWDGKWFENHKPSFYNMKTVVQSDISQTLQDSKEYTQKTQKSKVKYSTLQRLSAPRSTGPAPDSSSRRSIHKSTEWMHDKFVSDRATEERRTLQMRRERETQKKELSNWKTKKLDKILKAEADKKMSKQEDQRYAKEVHKFLCDDASNKLNEWAEKRKKQLQQAQKLRHTEDWKLTQKGALDRYAGRKGFKPQRVAGAAPRDEDKRESGARRDVTVI